MSKLLGPLLSIFRYHKKKIVLTFSLFVVFFFLLFPFNDLGDFVQNYVSTATAGQVLLSFDKMGVSMLPQPGVSLDSVSIDAQGYPNLKADRVSASLSIPALLNFSLGLRASARGLLGGEVDVSTRGTKSAQNKPLQKINLSAEQIDLAAISNLAQSPVQIKGRLASTISAEVDPTFASQPKGNLTLKGLGIIVPETLIPMMGETLPQLNFNTVDVQASAEKGILKIEKLVIGKSGEDLYANVTGNVELDIIARGGSPQPYFKGYDLQVRLELNENTQKRFGTLADVLLRQYRDNINKNAYSFRASTQCRQPPVNICRL